MKSIVLLSGGMDSALTLALASQKSATYALTVNYGQRHDRELQSAEKIASHFQVIEHLVVDVPLYLFGASALLKGGTAPRTNGAEPGIADTYVPARNTVLLAIAASYADSVGAESIWIGANSNDHEGYPDCRPSYFNAINEVLLLGTRHGPVVLSPLTAMSKADIVQAGVNLGIDWRDTWTCYNPINEHHCGVCDSCRVRKSAFTESDILDPTIYAA